MNKSLAVLILKLKITSLVPQEIEYPYSIKRLEEIDELTFSFASAQHFFETYKQDILNEIKRNPSKYQVQFPPTDIELIPKGMVIKVWDEEKCPLFRAVPIQGNMYNTLDVANKRLMQGRMYILYQADQMNQENPDYISIFKKCPPNMIVRIKNNNQITLKDLREFWYQLKDKPYRYSILRFILSDDMVLRITMNLEEDTKKEEGSRREKKYYWEED